MIGSANSQLGRDLCHVGKWLVIIHVDGYLTGLRVVGIPSVCRKNYSMNKIPDCMNLETECATGFIHDSLPPGCDYGVTNSLYFC